MTKKRESRAQHICPPTLESLIALVNSIPPDRKLPHFRDLMETCEEDKGRVVDLLIEKLAGVPQSFTEPDKFDKWRIFDNQSLDHGDYIASKYMHFRRLRKTVYEMAHLGSLSRNDRIMRRLELMFAPEGYEAAELGGELDIDDQTGLIVVRQDEWLNALIGIEADRLRECEMCGRVFWARQNNMVACNSRCGEANRKRRQRERDRLLAERKKRAKKP